MKRLILHFQIQPSNGLVGRPDRILVSKTGLRIESALTLGRGPIYEHQYGTQLYWNRFWIILEAAKQRTFGTKQNVTCMTDCGPRTSCRYKYNFISLHIGYFVGQSMDRKFDHNP